MLVELSSNLVPSSIQFWSNSFLGQVWFNPLPIQELFRVL